MFAPEKPQPTVFFAFLFIACLLCGIASASPSITLSKKTGPPTSRILVSGRGFKPNVGVDIFFDTKDEALVVTNGKGEFDKAGIHAHRGAQPGQHWVTAMNRNDYSGDQKAFLVQTNWSEFHFRHNGTRLNPYENVLDAKTVKRLKLKWTYSTSRIYAVDSSPAVMNGVVYVGSGDHNVYALNAKTGALLWRYTTGASVQSSPAVANGVVFVGSDDLNVYALNARTGHKLWSYNTRGVVESSPAVSNGVVYVGSNDGNMYALIAYPAKTTLLWSYKISYPVYSSPVVANGVVYVNSLVGIYALNAKTGAPVWSNVAGNGSPTVANGVVYLGSNALNASTGNLLWSNTTVADVEGTPALADRVVYVESYTDGGVYALDAATGAVLWVYHTNFPYLKSSPAVANGVVYIGAMDFNVYALDAKTGAKLWSYNVGDYLDSSPTVANGMVYIGCNNGKMYAFGLPDGDQAKQDADSKRPDPKTLRPDLSLKPSKPVAASGT